MSENYEYVAGFLFSMNEGVRHVTLIQKAKPRWLKGKWNGVGGKKNVGEDWGEAMAREFLEETGVSTQTPDWTHFATLYNDIYECRFFFYKEDLQQKSGARQMESEQVLDQPLALLHHLDLAPHVDWLIRFLTQTDVDPSCLPIMIRTRL